MRAVLILTLLFLPSATAEKWRLSYFYDDAREVLRFADIAFPTADRGIAVGTIIDEAHRRIRRHVAIVTSDGGKQWTEVPLRDTPQSLFFLSDSQGWLVGESAIWKTDEAGRSWRRVSGRRGMVSVWFLDAEHGFGVGEGAVIQETRDGGKHWKKIPVDFKLPGKPTIRLRQIAFVTPSVGLVLGSARSNSLRKLVELETKDGGVSWNATSGEMDADIYDLELRGNQALALMGGSRATVILIDLKTGASRIVYRSEENLVTSAALLEGRSFLAASPGSRRISFNGPALMLGRISVLESGDFRDWKEMPVDYRAEGTYAILAGQDSKHAFMATDQGMILRLE